MSKTTWIEVTCSECEQKYYVTADSEDAAKLKNDELDDMLCEECIEKAYQMEHYDDMVASYD